MKKVRIGVLGGYRGSSMINYCKRSDHAEVVAICDKSKEILDAQKDAEFAKYEEFFKDSVDFTELKEKKAEMSVKEIESELAIMFARKSLANPNFSKSNDGAMVAGIIDGNDDKEGFVAHSKYGLIRKS